MAIAGDGVERRRHGADRLDRICRYHCARGSSSRAMPWRCPTAGGAGSRPARSALSVSLRPRREAKAPERWAWEHFAGSPYQWGGVTPWGVDCSGIGADDVRRPGRRPPARLGTAGVSWRVLALEAIRPGDLLFFCGETSSGITHVAFAGDADTLIHSTLACGGTLMEPWLPGTRGGTLRPRLVAVRRLEER